MARRVFITVAEVSGDRHAAQLVAALRQLDPELVIEGLGGPEMAAAGATIHRETVGNAAMGVKGALRAFEVLHLLRWTRQHFQRHRPDLQIGVDSPSMNFHFAKLARGMDVPVMQYVAPQLWAWREGRMKKVRRWIDRLACVLPFEEAYFRRHGVDATFVGHPLFDSLPAHRDTNGHPRFPDRQPVIGLLPGSRKSEADANFRGLLGAAAQIREAFPGAKFLVPTTPATHPVVSAELRRAGVDWVEYRQDAFDEMVPRCDLCLTVSGTATLHVAGFGVPMIVVYHASRALWNLLGR
jgi:lipid-A-disaccharide synthase